MRRPHVRSQSSLTPAKIIWEFDPGRAQHIVDQMQQWVDAHQPGTRIDVHYDPSSPGSAALVATDMPLGGPQTPGNSRLTAGLAAICATLLAIGAAGRRFSVRQGTATPR